jgi:hypothetical protein
MSNVIQELNQKQRNEWEGFGTAGTFTQEGHEAQPTKPEEKSMTEAAGDLAREAGNKAESAVGAMGCGMQSLAQNIREHTPESGIVGSAASAVADTLDRGGHYLESQGLKGMAQDVTNLIRRNPIPALFIGIGLGFLIARATRSRS